MYILCRSLRKHVTNFNQRFEKYFMTNFSWLKSLPKLRTKKVGLKIIKKARRKRSVWKFLIFHLITRTYSKCLWRAKVLRKRFPFNPYSPNVTFLHPLKTSENLRRIWVNIIHLPTEHQISVSFLDLFPGKHSQMNGIRQKILDPQVTMGRDHALSSSTLQTHFYSFYKGKSQLLVPPKMT